MRSNCLGALACLIWKKKPSRTGAKSIKAHLTSVKQGARADIAHAVHGNSRVFMKPGRHEAVRSNWFVNL